MANSAEPPTNHVLLTAGVLWPCEAMSINQGQFQALTHHYKQLVAGYLSNALNWQVEVERQPTMLGRDLLTNALDGAGWASADKHGYIDSVLNGTLFDSACFIALANVTATKFTLVQSHTERTIQPKGGIFSNEVYVVIRADGSIWVDHQSRAVGMRRRFTQVENLKIMIGDLEAKIQDAGFTTVPWSRNPRLGDRAWRRDEAEVLDTVASMYPSQWYAALQAFDALFVEDKNWVHVDAEIQAGKTGTVTLVVLLVFANASEIGIRQEDCHVLTGMNELAWVAQTRARLPFDCRDQVRHNARLVDLEKQIRALARTHEPTKLLIVQDECHLGGGTTNQVSKRVGKPFDNARNLQAKWITLSATDPVNAHFEQQDDTSMVVRMPVVDGYQGIFELVEEKRIHETFCLSTMADAQRLVKLIEEKFPSPRYHIIRPRPSDYTKVKGNLKKLKFDVVDWTSTEKTRHDESEHIDDLNQLLKNLPKKHTVILIKNMFYASKTLFDDYLGVLHDRQSEQDDTVLQSLAGRACGYNRSKHTIIFTNVAAIRRYLDMWTQLSTDCELGNAAVVNHGKKAVNGKMKHVVAMDVSSNKCVAAAATSKFLPHQRQAQTKRKADELAKELKKTVKPSEANDGLLILYPVQEFLSYDELKMYCSSRGIPRHSTLDFGKDDNGKWMCSLFGTSKVQTADAVRAFLRGKKATGLFGYTINDRFPRRVYIGYEGDSPVFFLKYAEHNGPPPVRKRT